MKKILSILFFLSAFLQIAHAISYEVSCDPRLQRHLNKILKLPNAKQLITQIQQQGPIRISVVNHALSQQFGAFWDRQNREIGIQLSSRENEGKIIGSLIFELHNAFTNGKVDHLDSQVNLGQIGREKYVRAMEHLEFQNSKNASALAQEGIDKGLFPTSAHLNTYSTFEEHFYYQKISGHSACFEQAYDQMRRR